MPTDYTYGPARPPQQEEWGDFRTEPYIQGPAQKIILDLERVASLYNGKLTKILTRSNGDRCLECTNELTGARMLTDCDVCQGTGIQGGYVDQGDFWVVSEFGPKTDVTSEFGNSDGMGGGRDTFVLVGAPMLKDQDILIPKAAKEVFKIIDVEPQIVAMQGVVITQIAQCSMISPGSHEYSLIDW